MKHTHTSLLACAAVAALFYSTSTANAQPSLGTAQTFAALGAATVTNTGPTALNGDVGVSPGTAVTGFGPGILTGTIHAADGVAAQAQADALAAYNAAAGLPVTQALTGQDLGTVATLTPGVYFFSSSAQLTGTLTLDFQGNPNAAFVFQIGSTLTTASAASVVVINSAQTCNGSNVFWQVGSSATLGTGTQFVGHIVALASVSLTTGATLSGSAIALTGAVTMDSNFVSICIGGDDTLPPPDDDDDDDDGDGDCDNDHNGGNNHNGGNDHYGDKDHKGGNDHYGDKDHKGGNDHYGDKDHKGGKNHKGGNDHKGGGKNKKGRG